MEEYKVHFFVLVARGARVLFAGCAGEAREAAAGSLGPAGAAVQGRGSSQEGQGVCGQAHPSPVPSLWQGSPPAQPPQLPLQA